MNLKANEAVIRTVLTSPAGAAPVRGQGVLLHPASVHKLPSGTVMLIAEDAGGGYLIEWGTSSSPRFLGDDRSRAVFRWDGGRLSVLPLTTVLVEELAEELPWSKPVPIGSRRPSFGWGNRTLLSTLVVLGLFREWQHRDRFGVVIAQNSVRENEILERHLGFREVTCSAALAKIVTGYTWPTGSDADHLKTLEEIDDAVRAGFTGFTIDPSAVLRKTEGVIASGERTLEDIANDPGLQRLYDASVQRNHLDGLLDRVLGRLETEFGEFRSGDRFLDRRLAMAAIAKFGNSISFVHLSYDHLRRSLGKPFDFEASFDETEAPTPPLAHLLIAEALVGMGVELTRFAVRFVGRFEKTTDYIGDLSAFRADLERHQRVAKRFGYLLSIHSGSGKYSLYPHLPGVHLKMSGDLSRPIVVALARTDFDLYARLHADLIESAKSTKKLYGAVSSPSNDFDALPRDVRCMKPEEVVNLLETDVRWRTMSHYAYGMFKRAEGLFAQSLFDHREAYVAEVAKTILAHRDPIAKANGL